MKFLKFHNYLMEGFKIDLKTFWGLATIFPNCQKVNIKHLGQKSPNLHDPYI